MRLTTLLIIFNLLAAHTHAQADLLLFNEKDSTVITGIIKYHDPSKDEKMISFRAKDLQGQSVPYTALINNDGSFRCSILQPYAGNFSIRHKNIYTELYGEPGEKIGLVIHNNRIDSTNNLPAIFEVSGKSSPVSRGMLLFSAEKIPSSEDKAPGIGNKELPDEVFSQLTRDFYQKELIRLTGFLEKNKLNNNTVLRNWLTNKIIYSAAWKITFNPFLGKSNLAMTPEKLKDLLGDIPLYHEGSLQNSEYYTFLKSLTFGIQICVNTNPTYVPLKRSSGNNSYPLYLEQINRLLLPSPAKEMAYYITYDGAMPYKISADDALKYQDRFDENIQTPYLKKEMNRVREKWRSAPVQVDIIGKIRSFQTTESIRKHLVSVVETATKDKYAFVDFWGSWCAPCMGEMPYYAAMIDTCRNKPVNFLFLSLQTSEADAKQAKEKFGINASFINLSDDEINVLNQVFGFTSYPSHFVLAPGGMMLGRYEGSIASATRNRTAIVKEPIHLFSLIK